MTMPSVEIVEVAPRDGLQNERVPITTADKLALIARAIDAGVRRIEVTSFVNPRAVPQMADAEQVCAGLPMRDDVTFIGVVLNRRGADRAIATGRIDELGAVAVASDTFAMANQGQTSAGSIEAVKAILDAGHTAAIGGQVTIATAFGCPFEGEVPEPRVLAMAEALAAFAPSEIGLADTIGVGNPAQVGRIVSKVRDLIAPIPVRVHFHNTRGTGLANVWAALGEGARIIDAAIGGLGGCPFAPGATGNVSTEDVVYMLDRAGVRTGLDLAALVASNHWLGRLMDRALPGMVAKAPPFPKPA